MVKPVTVLIVLAMLQAAAVPLSADPYENGREAYRKDDFTTAVKEFHKAAIAGHTAAQYALAIEYVKGKGVERNLVLAHFWFNIAGQAGDKDAVHMRKLVADRMKRAELKEAKRLAAEWQAKKANPPAAQKTR